MNFKKIISWLIVLAILIGAGYGGYRYWQKRQAAIAAMAQQNQSSGPIPMPVAGAKFMDVTDTLSFTGTTEAVNVYEVQARVEGYLQGIHFTDGDLVEKGQLLFTIEPDIYRALRDEAAAMLKSGKAELLRAKFDLERIEKAVKSGAVSRQDLTSAKAAYDKADAMVMGYKAALAKAELNLSYTEIRSPISGRIGDSPVDVGNLVGPGDRTLLAVVRQIEPVNVFFHVSESLLKGDFLKRLQGKQGFEPQEFNVGLPNENEFPFKGAVNFVDNTVDTRTGTIYVRGEVANKSQQLLPGMFVQVQMPIGHRKDAVVIAAKAINSDLGGKFVLIVNDENTLERRDVKLGDSMGKMRVINEGLDGSEQFIVGGFHMARPGMQIQPMPVENNNTAD
ncbi:Multidrug transporter MdtA [Limihaloglobus sulfuriphilus]|uniref:Multidrug transporter MdtA n=1 Tax=Limihaloglobus sulfuriphilus TaxID=1851148 RepID=A0A1Q2MAK4_9BACT|nr:efflux RND transporter periplasmic adaptor subunit [Limihaloglobus sulfuriphilus]AQQ69689.1 Multidrug transporter MdtA [Limihaloglobus sulfuriphilus]